MDINNYIELMILLNKSQCPHCNSYFNKKYLKKHIEKLHKYKCNLNI